MRIVLILQDDPFYLPEVADRLTRVRGHDIVALVIPSPRPRAATTKEMVRRSLIVYGLLGTLRQGAKYVRYRALDRLPDRLNGGRVYSLTSVARKHGIAVLRPTNVNEERFLTSLRRLKPDLIASIAAEQVFREDLLRLPRMGCVNVHSSLLPTYRGLYPSFWVLANNERETGVTVHYMDSEIDNGAILLQRQVPIASSDTQHSLLEKTKRVGAELLLEVFRQIEQGKVAPQPNRDEEATYFSFPTRADAKRFRAAGKRFW